MSILALENNKLDEYLNDFYSCFEQGYDFEVFLQHFLIKIGLDDVRVTQKTRDGGIDLTAVRYGIISISDLDSVKYIIQAKCKKPSSTIASPDIDALRGNMGDGEKGLFVSTCKYTKDAFLKAESNVYRSRPIVLIDGKTLISTCIENEIGFDFIPKINREDIIAMSKEQIQSEVKKKFITIDDEIEKRIINKQISNNDIRARILRLPKDIKTSLDIVNKKTIIANINGIKNVELTVDASKSYLAGVTDIYREYSLISPNGETNSTIVKMFVDKDRLNLIFDEKF